MVPPKKDDQKGDANTHHEYIVAKRLRKQGQVVMPVPLYIRRKPSQLLEQQKVDSSCTNNNTENDECRWEQQQQSEQQYHDINKEGTAICASRPDTSLLICPIFFTGGELEIVKDPKQANAKFQWSKWNTANGRKLKPDVVLKVCWN